MRGRRHRVNIMQGGLVRRIDEVNHLIGGGAGSFWEGRLLRRWSDDFEEEVVASAQEDLVGRADEGDDAVCRVEGHAWIDAVEAGRGGGEDAQSEGEVGCVGRGVGRGWLGRIAVDAVEVRGADFLHDVVEYIAGPTGAVDLVAADLSSGPTGGVGIAAVGAAVGRCEGIGDVGEVGDRNCDGADGEGLVAVAEAGEAEGEGAGLGCAGAGGGAAGARRGDVSEQLCTALEVEVSGDGNALRGLGYDGCADGVFAGSEAVLEFDGEGGPGPEGEEGLEFGRMLRVEAGGGQEWEESGEEVRFGGATGHGSGWMRGGVWVWRAEG